MVWAVFDNMIVASSDKEWENDPSKYKCWKLFRATLKQKLHLLVHPKRYLDVLRILVFDPEHPKRGQSK